MLTHCCKSFSESFPYHGQYPASSLRSERSLSSCQGTHSKPQVPVLLLSGGALEGGLMICLISRLLPTLPCL